DVTCNVRITWVALMSTLDEVVMPSSVVDNVTVYWPAVVGVNVDVDPVPVAGLATPLSVGPVQVSGWGAVEPPPVASPVTVGAASVRSVIPLPRWILVPSGTLAVPGPTRMVAPGLPLETTM